MVHKKRKKRKQSSRVRNQSAQSGDEKCQGRYYQRLFAVVYKGQTSLLLGGRRAEMMRRAYLLCYPMGPGINHAPTKKQLVHILSFIVV